MTTDSDGGERTVERLRELQSLRDEGLISAEEFDERRALVLDQAFGSGRPATSERQGVDGPEPPAQQPMSARAQQRRQQSAAARSRPAAARARPRPSGAGQADRAGSPASPRRNEGGIRVHRAWLIVAAVAFALFVAYSCGPEAICLAQNGDLAQNALGVEWCDLDRDGRLSEGDFRLSW